MAPCPATSYLPAMPNAVPLRYTLTAADALAYERLPRALTGMQRATLYLWLVLAGILLVALPPELVGTISSPRFWLTGAAFLIIQWFIYTGLRWWWQRSRAQAHYPHPVDISLEPFDDHLLITENGRTRRIPFEEIGVLLPTATHLFMAVGRDLVIVPRAAFGDAAGMTELVDTIDGYMRAHPAAFAEETVADDPGAALPPHDA
ncbi:MAG TPA: hypothetical protein VHB74_07880 [Devosia sp.]|nr:hypothetical protein [Devosia sp.]